MFLEQDLANVLYDFMVKALKITLGALFVGTIVGIGFFA